MITYVTEEYYPSNVRFTSGISRKAVLIVPCRCLNSAVEYCTKLFQADQKIVN